jgi:2,4-dienoyl-CoA reductase (NADPH2)
MNSALNAAAQATLAAWHAMIRTRDTSGLSALLDAEAVFRSPVANKPYHGAAAVTLILQTAEQVFANFEYHREFVSGDGRSVVLEFSADVGDRSLKGIDMIRFNDAGNIVEFEVMVRPATGVQALGEAMAQRLAGRI